MQKNKQTNREKRKKGKKKIKNKQTNRLKHEKDKKR